MNYHTASPAHSTRSRVKTPINDQIHLGDQDLNIGQREEMSPVASQLAAALPNLQIGVQQNLMEKSHQSSPAPVRSDINDEFGDIKNASFLTPNKKSTTLQRVITPLQRFIAQGRMESPPVPAARGIVTASTAPRTPIHVPFGFGRSNKIARSPVVRLPPPDIPEENNDRNMRDSTRDQTQTSRFNYNTSSRGSKNVTTRRK